MPELPDVVVSLEALERHVGGQLLEDVRVKSPFLVRSVAPPLSAAPGRRVEGFQRLGKRLVWRLEGELYLVLHLMVAGRLRWRKRGAGIPGRIGLAAFDFARGTVLLTEASKKKRASLYVVEGAPGLAEHDRGGLEVLEAPLEAFRDVLQAHNHTLKRALTDPRLFSGIGNAYSDEILVRAGLSPLTWTTRLSNDEVRRLYDVTRATLTDWTEQLRAEVGEGFPETVTAFREGMAVHGRYGLPCGVCGTPVQRIRYAENETNYCTTCQTGGKLLADRGLSRLLKKDWPKSLDELEALKQSHREKLGRGNEPEHEG
jgi:formamidopyrimidine-DNA glycosylase